MTPPLFLATKLEAFAGRGHDDLLTSRDAEDILLIIDGRESTIDEVVATDADVRVFIAEQFLALVEHPDFDDFLEGNIRGPAGRVALVRDRFIAISQSADGVAHEN